MAVMPPIKTTSLRGQSEVEAACSGVRLEDPSPPLGSYGA